MNTHSSLYNKSLLTNSHILIKVLTIIKFVRKFKWYIPLSTIVYWILTLYHIWLKNNGCLLTIKGSSWGSLFRMDHIYNIYTRGSDE